MQERVQGPAGLALFTHLVPGWRKGGHYILQVPKDCTQQRRENISHTHQNTAPKSRSWAPGSQTTINVHHTHHTLAPSGEEEPMPQSSGTVGMLNSVRWFGEFVPKQNKTPNKSLLQIHRKNGWATKRKQTKINKIAKPPWTRNQNDVPGDCGTGTNVPTVLWVLTARCNHIPGFRLRSQSS